MRGFEIDLDDSVLLGANAAPAMIGSPHYSIAPAAPATEGNTATFVVTRNYTGATATVNFTVTDGTTSGSSDYAVPTSTVTFQSGSLSATISIPTVEDSFTEDTETFTVTLTGVAAMSSGSLSATGTINDDDTYILSPTTVTEGQTATILVMRTGDISQSASLTYALGMTGDTASATSDYSPSTGSVSWAPNVATATIMVATVDDSTPEPTESFTVTLNNVQAQLQLATLAETAVIAALVQPTSATTTVTITDNDTQPGGGGGGGGGGSTPPPFQFTPGPDNYTGDDSAELLRALGDNDTVAGTGGNDTIFGMQGDDSLSGGNDADSLSGGQGNDTIRGDFGDDLIAGNVGNDRLAGNAGNDTLMGGQGNDTVYGGQGNDRMYGGQGDDVAYGNLGNDLISGNMGNDSVFGGQGDDTLYGGQGNDTLVGGLGNDLLLGDAGADRFVFGTGSGTDRIGGLSQASGDRLDLQGQTFTVTTGPDGSAVLNLSGGGTVTLTGIAPGSVNPGFFA